MIRVDVARPDSLRQPDDGPVGMSVDDDRCGGKSVNSNRLRRPATAQQQRNLAPAARPHRGENPQPGKGPPRASAGRATGADLGDCDSGEYSPGRRSRARRPHPATCRPDLDMTYGPPL
jgi:hypothetical protein